MKESDIEDILETGATIRGGLAVKHVSPGRAGDLDRLVALPMTECPCCGSRARVGLLELKRPGVRGVDELQAQRAAEWGSIGVPTGWASSALGVHAFLAALAAPLNLGVLK